MATTNLNRDVHEIQSGLDCIVVIKAFADIPGGRSLNVEDVAANVTVLKAGHIIVAKDDDYKPMPVATGGAAYGTLPTGYSYVGVLKKSVPVKDARAAIVTAGQVNAAASPYPITSAIKTALSHIQFLYA